MQILATRTSRLPTIRPAAYAARGTARDHDRSDRARRVLEPGGVGDDPAATKEVSSVSEVPETAPTSFVIVELARPPRQAFRFAEQADALRLAERLRRADPDAAVRTQTPDGARDVLLDLAFVPEDGDWPADHHGVAASRPRDRGGPLPGGGRRMTMRTARRDRGAGITAPRRVAWAIGIEAYGIDCGASSLDRRPPRWAWFETRGGRVVGDKRSLASRAEWRQSRDTLRKRAGLSSSPGSTSSPADVAGHAG